MDGRWRITLKNLFFPVFCRECTAPILTEENVFFCPTCWERPPRIEPPWCERCGRPFADRVGFADTINGICGECRTQRDSWCDHIRGAAIYDGAIAGAIKLFKFQQRERLAQPLVDELLSVIDTTLYPEHYTHLMPVPLHRVRLRDRGFNQAERLTRGVASQFPNALVSELLERHRPTRVQSRIQEAGDRRANIAGAFRVKGGQRMDGASVLLIDDVVTSGATVQECARALKEVGAVRVDVLAVALTHSADYGLSPKRVRRPARLRQQTEVEV